MEQIKSNFFSVLNHVIAVISATVLSIKYNRSLKIKKDERRRYFKKSISLGLCYAGFAELRKIQQSWLAGEAAFFCCAYDVVTDWRRFDQKARLDFEELLRREEMIPELKKLTMNLYYKELNNQLEDDGLDRGAIALRFILKMMRCEDNREITWNDLDEIGQLLQIVDDVLDYEEDITYGDTNCLTSEKRNFYLRKLIKEFEDAKVKKLFGSHTLILTKVIQKAVSKAEILVKEKVIVNKCESIQPLIISK